MTQRMLVAVADSPASMTAARTAVALAARLGADVRVHVVQDGDITTLIGTASRAGT